MAEDKGVGSSIHAPLPAEVHPLVMAKQCCVGVQFAVGLALSLFPEADLQNWYPGRPGFRAQASGGKNDLGSDTSSYLPGRALCVSLILLERGTGRMGVRVEASPYATLQTAHCHPVY